MYRLELIKLIVDKSRVNHELSSVKTEFTKTRNLESFNKMQELSKKYQDLNNRIYTYNGINYFYSLLDNRDKHNKLWEPYDIQLNRSDVIFNIEYDDYCDVMNFIILSESKNRMPTFRIEYIHDASVFTNYHENFVSYDLYDQTDELLY